jgi:hypothetical protein
MKEYVINEGVITRIYCENGDLIIECDDDFQEMIDEEMIDEEMIDEEDETETLRRPNNPLTKKIAKRFFGRIRTL